MKDKNIKLCKCKCKCKEELLVKNTEKEIEKLRSELEFEKEKNRRFMWLLGLTGGNAFIEKDKEPKIVNKMETK